MTTFKKLTMADVDAVWLLFKNTADIFLPSKVIQEQNFDSFCDTFLNDLQQFDAYGAFNEEGLVAVLTLYRSTDEPAWFLKHFRATAEAGALLKYVIKECEKKFLYKFYALKEISPTETDLIDTDFAVDGYKWLYETSISPYTRCIYTHAWNFLFDRQLFSEETSLLCCIFNEDRRMRNDSGFI